MIWPKTLLNLGITTDMDLVESNKQRVFNLFLLVAIPSLPLALLYNFIRDNIGMVVMNSLQLVIMLFALWISISRKLLFLRTYLLVILSVIVFYAAIQFQTGIEYRLLLLLVVGILLFDNDTSFLYFTFLIATEFSICKVYALNQMGIVGIKLFIQFIQVFLPFLITGISLYYFKRIYLSGQIRLKETLYQVSAANEKQEKLMYSLAHDLRSPLNSVTSLVKLLKKHDQYSIDEIKYLDIIESSTINANALLNELLESNELMHQSLNLKYEDIVPILSQAILNAQLKANNKSVQLEFQSSIQNLYLKIDRLKIDRLFSNILNNAIKFSHPGGHVLITTKEQKDHFIIGIKDEGIGIADNDIKRIFDPFTKAKRKGTQNEASFGLGLSICKQIATLHGGSIAVSTKYGEGTRFDLIFPKTNG